jgi:hypothetical protein
MTSGVATVSLVCVQATYARHPFRWVAFKSRKNRIQSQLLPSTMI